MIIHRHLYFLEKETEAQRCFFSVCNKAVCGVGSI